MSKKLCLLICFVLLLVITSQSFAETIDWTNADPNDNLWRTPGNWDLNRVPSVASGDRARIVLQSPNGCIIDYTHTGVNAAEAGIVNVANTGNAGDLLMTGGKLTLDGHFRVGQGSFGRFDVYGGTVTGVDRLVIGQEVSGTGIVTIDGGSIAMRVIQVGISSGVGTLNMHSGTIDITQLHIGRGTGNGKVNMSGGTINIAQFLAVGKTVNPNPGAGSLEITGGKINIGGKLNVGLNESTGHIQLDGGTTLANKLKIENVSATDPCSILDITAGTLILEGDARNIVSSYTNEPNDWLIADGGSGNVVVDYDIRNSGKTTVTATSNDISLPQLTINVEPNDIGIEDSIVPSITGPIYYWQDKTISIGVGPSAANCPYVYRFDHWVGDVDDVSSPSTTVLMDSDKTVTVVFVKDEQRVCGDVCHPIPVGDITGDCYVNMDDFAIYAEGWLNCTHPDCDEL